MTIAYLHICLQIILLEGQIKMLKTAVDLINTLRANRDSRSKHSHFTCLTKSHFKCATFVLRAFR